MIVQRARAYGVVLRCGAACAAPAGLSASSVTLGGGWGRTNLSRSVRQPGADGERDFLSAPRQNVGGVLVSAAGCASGARRAPVLLPVEFFHRGGRVAEQQWCRPTAVGKRSFWEFFSMRHNLAVQGSSAGEVASREGEPTCRSTSVLLGRPSARWETGAGSRALGFRRRRAGDRRRRWEQQLENSDTAGTISYPTSRGGTSRRF